MAGKLLSQWGGLGAHIHQGTIRFQEPQISYADRLEGAFKSSAPNPSQYCLWEACGGACAVPPDGSSNVSTQCTKCKGQLFNPFGGDLEQEGLGPFLTARMVGQGPCSKHIGKIPSLKTVENQRSVQAGGGGLFRTWWRQTLTFELTARGSVWRCVGGLRSVRNRSHKLTTRTAFQYSPKALTKFGIQFPVSSRAPLDCGTWQDPWGKGSQVLVEVGPLRPRSRPRICSLPSAPSTRSAAIRPWLSDSRLSSQLRNGGALKKNFEPSCTRLAAKSLQLSHEPQRPHRTIASGRRGRPLALQLGPQVTVRTIPQTEL